MRGTTGARRGTRGRGRARGRGTSTAAAASTAVARPSRTSAQRRGTDSDDTCTESSPSASSEATQEATDTMAPVTSTVSGQNGIIQFEHLTLENNNVEGDDDDNVVVQQLPENTDISIEEVMAAAGDIAFDLNDPQLLTEISETRAANLAESTRLQYERRIDWFNQYLTEQGYTPTAVFPELPDLIAAYLQKYVINDGLSLATFECEYSAIKHKYRVLAELPEHRHLLNIWSSHSPFGNPFTCPTLVRYLAGGKKILMRTSTPKSSRPLTYLEMKAIKEWYESLVRENQERSNNRQAEKRLPFSKHQWVVFRAAIVVGWYCMMRGDELVSLKWGDIDMDQTVPGTNSHYHRLRLLFRKTNQFDTDQMFNFDLYSVANESAADPYKAMKEYRDLLQQQSISMQEDTSLFKKVSAGSTGGFYQLESLSSDDIKTFLQKCLRGIGHSAQQSAQWTTHCLRRGGAQHRQSCELIQSEKATG